MRYKTEDEFARAVKSSGIKGLYFLYGSEEYLVDAWKNRLSEPFARAGDFNFQIFDGRALNVSSLYDAAEALPLMSEQKCVVAADIDVSGLSAGDMDMLCALLGGLNPDCVLILTGKSAFDAKAANSKRLIKAAEESGSVIELGSRGQSGLVAFLRAQARKNGCGLSSELAKKMIEYCGGDMNTLSRELEKVCAYSGYGEINAYHIESSVIQRTEARVFDLSRHILSGNPKKAMETLSDLFYLRESPVSILTALSSAFIDLYRARIAKDNGVSQENVTNMFPYKGREFRVRNAFNTRLQAEAVRDCLYILCECDKKIKGSGVDDRVLLEQAVVGLFIACDAR